ncbi:hypothetical protein SAMN02799631_00996 [Methylobacterium sp. 174MFSha1.1]|uniref:hypothetical protein n=1 Tax=Methylobacterium sp. 174MFSha1.1 TaxID=1502749 RepID=UPI0008E46901|nr:hypothetical protein [Methylobacterium sp. 174MFSha1.1]SFU50543.1 hypothetical protein SAMN02799631_00996 [Methylobacterium sp. 174MFSha1.1]
MILNARLVAILITLLSAAALAQDAGGPPLPAQIRGNAPDAPSAEAPALPFATSAALRAETVARHVRELRATNPIAAAEVAREMARHDYDAIFQGFLDGTELRAGDAGDVLTAFIALQWMVANDATVEPSAAALRAVRRQMVVPLADKPPLSQDASRAAFAEQVKLRAVLHHAGWQAAKRLGMLPTFLAGLSKDFIPPAKLRAVVLTDDGLVGKGARRPAREAPAAAAASPTTPAPTTPAPAEPEPPAEPRHAANWAGVEGVYFRAATGVGVGGMVVIEYEPLILFRDGTSYEIADAALEDVDLAAERAAHPRRFGRWTRAGDAYRLTGQGGKPQDYKLQDGSFFRAFPAEAGERTIARAYRRLSGGGTSAMGGDVTVAVSNRYDFRQDGTYGRGGSLGATNSGASTGVGSAIGRRRAPEGGRYALERHTLTLAGPDGRSRRLFFAFGSQGDPARPDREMAFIGGSVFSNPD